MYICLPKAAAPGATTHTGWHDLRPKNLLSGVKRGDMLVARELVTGGMFWFPLMREIYETLPNHRAPLQAVRRSAPSGGSHTRSITRRRCPCVYLIFKALLAKPQTLKAPPCFYYVALHGLSMLHSLWVDKGGGGSRFLSQCLGVTHCFRLVCPSRLPYRRK